MDPIEVFFFFLRFNAPGVLVSLLGLDGRKKKRKKIKKMKDELFDGLEERKRHTEGIHTGGGD